MRRRRKTPGNRLGRALTGLALGLGVGAIALSFLPASPPRAVLPVLPDADVPELAQPASPARAAPVSRQTAPPATQPNATAAQAAPIIESDAADRSISETAPVSVASPEAVAPPVIRQAAPKDARPAIDARALGDARIAGQRAGAAPAPFSVVVTLQNPHLQGSLGQTIVSGLNQAGFLARIASLAEAGRPDVILALSAVPGDRNEAWYCEPGPVQSVLLAFLLLDSLGSSEPAADLAAAEPRSEFPCAEIHAGRARVPAVLLELGEGGSPDDGWAVVATLRQYFEQQRSEVLAARAVPRLVWPAKGPVTSHYGLDHPLGIDIGQFEGPIVAANDGVVVFAGGNPCCSYGYYVVLQGLDGIGTLYAHLNSISVNEGQRVRQGQVLGEVGCTGTCFGTHLHFEVFQAGNRLDPMRHLP